MFGEDPALYSIIALYVGVGLVAGFMGGLLGIGGGLITVPVIFSMMQAHGYGSPWGIHIAVGTSLAIIVFVGSASAWAHHKRGAVDLAFLKQVWWVVAVGALLGSQLAQSLRSHVLIYSFAGFAGLLAVKMFVPAHLLHMRSHLPKRGWAYPGPFAIGLFSALVGIGGGSLTVPYMTACSVDVRRAVATASVLGVVISVAGGAGVMLGGLSVTGLPEYSLGYVHLPSLAVLAPSAVLAAPLGAKAAHTIPQPLLRVVFGLFLIVAVWRLVSAA